MECIESTSDNQKKKDRILNSETLSKFNEHLNNGKSQRAAANDVGVARNTLCHWNNRASKNPLSSVVIDFFESPDGSLFLDSLVTALQFVMTQVGSCGIRLVSLFLELSNLKYFVASSYETLRKRGKIMEEHIVDFGNKEKSRLAKSMPPRKISIVEDETFHPKPCLVAMEPVSNFILLEQYSSKRDAASWNKMLDESLIGLPVEIIQSTSDEAQGIINHVEKHLGGHHSSDIFHVQYEISKGTSAAMSSKVRSAEKTLEKLEQELKNRVETKEVKKAKGRPSILSSISDKELKSKISDAKTKLVSCESQQLDITNAKKEIANVYHPYELSSGKKREPAQLKQELDHQFEILEKNSKAANLKQTSLDKIAKSKRVCPNLVATLSFFWMMVKQIVEEYSLSKITEEIIYNYLIPSEYLMIASKKAKTSDERNELYQQGQILISQLKNNLAWKDFDKKEQERLTSIAKQCAQIFQRSSSCLEGRNGYLSLRHHGLHNISDRKLGALTVIHNYFIKRPDGTSAAERFFGQQPANLFKNILDQMPSLPRPAKKRARLDRAA